MPILTSVLLRCNGTSLTVAATDLATTMTATVPVTSAAAGGVAIPARRLLDVVRGLPAGAVSIASVDGGKVEVKAGRATYLLVGEMESDFPKLPTAPTSFAPVHPAPLHRLLKRVAHAICDDSSREHIGCVRLEKDGDRVRSVATDGHQLATAREDLGWALPRDISIPARGVRNVLALLAESPDASVAVQDRHLWVRRGAVSLCVILGESEFPPWGQVVPRTHASEAIVAVADFVGAVKRLTGMLARSTKSGDSVKMTFGDGQALLTAKGDGIGEGEEIVEVGWDGEPIEIGASAGLVMEMAGALGGESMRVRFGAPLDPVMFAPQTGDDFLGLVMPMRL
jgi:DNA polymerase-3 subunit beta